MKYNSLIGISCLALAALTVFVSVDCAPNSAVCYGRVPFNVSKCTSIIPSADISADEEKKSVKVIEDRPCLPELRGVCKHARFVGSLKGYEPFNNLLMPIAVLGLVIPACCKCHWWNGTDRNSNSERYESYDNFFTQFMIDLKRTNLSGVAWPIFGETDSESQNGFHFAPIFELSKAIYLTSPPEGDEMMLALLEGIFGLFPLLLICLLMAFIAGFCGWIMETWNNEEEFQRSFIPGVWNGFWWSFVSMTTVGYGDKSPKSVMARIFAVLWILIGITICSMFTAALTAAINDAGNVYPQGIQSGAKVGILKFRLFEMSIVVNKGGTPVVGRDITTLLDKLDNGEIDGVLLDTFTKMFHQHDLKGRPVYLQKDEPWMGPSVSYGMIFTEKTDFDFFGNAIKDNKVLVKTCVMLGFPQRGKTSEALPGVFSPESGMFYPFLGASLVTIIFILIFGIMYERIRKTKEKNKVTTNLELKEKQDDVSTVTYEKTTNVHHEKLTANIGEQEVPPFF